MKNQETTPISNWQELESDRLTLRKLTTADAAQLSLLRSNQSVNRYLYRTGSTSLEEALQFVNKILAADSYYWAINFRDQAELIGTICLWNFDLEHSVVEIGYELLPPFQGKGLMTEAIQAVIAYNSTVLKFATIIGTTHMENSASIRLLEKNHFTIDQMRQNQLLKVDGASMEIVYSLKGT